MDSAIDRPESGPGEIRGSDGRKQLTVRALVLALLTGALTVSLVWFRQIGPESDRMYWINGAAVAFECSVWLTLVLAMTRSVDKGRKVVAGVLVTLAVVLPLANSNSLLGWYMVSVASPALLLCALLVCVLRTRRRKPKTHNLQPSKAWGDSSVDK